MSIESYLRAIPKFELGLQFEGIVPQKSFLMIADHNDKTSEKGFAGVKRLLAEPDYAQLNNLTDVLSTWVLYPDDLTRLAYDVGVALSKHNVKYAEISLNPLQYTQSNMSFEKFIEALADGADRAKRGWGVSLNWVMNIPRSDPRRSDEISRWALSATGRKNNVVALGLGGREDSADAVQFERPFRNVEKKDLARVVQAGDQSGVNGIAETLQYMNPNRIVGGWGATESDELLKQISARGIPLAICPTRELKLNRIASIEEYPLRRLLDAKVPVVFTGLLPEFYKTSIADELINAVNANLIRLDEADEIVLNGVRYSLLPDDEKRETLKTFQSEMNALRAENLPA